MQCQSVKSCIEVPVERGILIHIGDGNWGVFTNSFGNRSE